MDNYFKSFLSFYLLILELTTFEQQMCSTKKDYAYAPTLGETTAKKGSCHFEQCTSKLCNFDRGCLERQQVTQEQN